MRIAADDGPVYYYVYNRTCKSSTLLFSDYPELEELPLVFIEPVSYPTEDGLTIHGYLTLPQGGSIPFWQKEK